MKLVNELLEQDRFEVSHIYCTEDYTISELKGAEITLVSDKELERISTLKNPNQVLAVVKQIISKELNYSNEQLSLMLDTVNDPGNLGTIIRTADWFGVNQLICSLNSVDIYNPKVIQSTMGAIFRLNIVYTNLNEALNEFKKNGFDLVSAEMDGESIYETDFKTKTLLLMGSESHGVDEELSNLTRKITIPAVGQTESLNVAMATGIILSHYSKSVK